MLEVLRQAKELGVTRAWCGNLGAIDMARNAGLSPVGGYSLNITNSAAVQEYAALGLTDTELSFELPVTRARSLGGFLPQGILALWLSAADGTAQLSHQGSHRLRQVPGL